MSSGSLSPIPLSRTVNGNGHGSRQLPLLTAASIILFSTELELGVVVFKISESSELLRSLSTTQASTY